MLGGETRFSPQPNTGISNPGSIATEGKKSGTPPDSPEALIAQILGNLSQQVVGAWRRLKATKQLTKEQTILI
jgi:hypothetical protein